MNNAGSKQIRDCGNKHDHGSSENGEREEKSNIASNHQITIKMFCLIGKIGEILSFTKLSAHGTNK